MVHRSFIQLALQSVVLAVGVAASAAAFAKEKVVFQLTEADPAKGNLVFNNVRNLQTGVGGAENAEIEVVAYGPGVTLLKADSPIAARIAEATGSQVHVMACENTMANMHLARTEMLPTVGYVPAGVVEVMRKQQQGYAYIRP